MAMNIFSSLLQYDFMKNAFVAVALISVLFGILGTMIVHKRMAFFSDALGHSAFTGVAIGALCSLSDSTVAMVCFAVVFALLLNRIKRKNSQSYDTIISVFASLATALGLAVLSMNGNFSKYSNLLVGDILAITKNEIIALVITLIVTIVFWCVCLNALNAVSISPTIARNRGIHVNLIEDIFCILIAIVVMLSIKWVGLLLINALLILPAASARNISYNMREYHIFSIVFAALSGFTGLIVSYFLNMATGPAIVIIAGVIYFVTYFARKR